MRNIDSSYKRICFSNFLPSDFYFSNKNTFIFISSVKLMAEKKSNHPSFQFRCIFSSSCRGIVEFSGKGNDDDWRFITCYFYMTGTYKILWPFYVIVSIIIVVVVCWQTQWFSSSVCRHNGFHVITFVLVDPSFWIFRAWILVIE